MAPPTLKTAAAVARLEDIMCAHLVRLVLVAAIGASVAHSALADAKNLSCISDESVHARKVVRDCAHEHEEPTYTIVYEQPVDPNGPPIPVKHGEGRDHHGGRGSNSDGGNGGGGNAGGPN